MHLPLIASCGCVSENTPLPALAGLLPAPECRSLISEASKPFGGYQILRESVLHPNNYLPRFLIINSFNLFTLNQFYLINLLFSGKLPTFQIFQRRISLSGLAKAHPEEVPTRQGPSSTSSPLAPSSYRRVSVPVDVILSSVHLIISHSLLTFHKLSIIGEWLRLNFSTLKWQRYSDLGSVIFRRLCN